MNRIGLLILTITGWSIGTTMYAIYYVESILASPEPYDAYARNWQFQLAMFSLFRLPYMLLLLPILLYAVVLVTKDSRGNRTHM